MNILESLGHAARSLWHWASQFHVDIFGVFHRLGCEVFGEILHLTWGIMAAIPIPPALAGYTFPDPGPLAWALTALGVPTAMGIISAAFTIRMAMKLIPFIHA